MPGQAAIVSELARLLSIIDSLIYEHRIVLPGIAPAEGTGWVSELLLGGLLGIHGGLWLPGENVAGSVNGISDGVFGAIVGCDFNGVGFSVSGNSVDSVYLADGILHAFLTPGTRHALNREFILLHMSSEGRYRGKRYGHRNSAII
jgi:uncharacterized membrane protein YeaQ/YmgE (transglycosylase-associated protein family)